MATVIEVGLRATVLGAILLGLSACTTAVQHTGRAPEGVREPVRHETTPRLVSQLKRRAEGLDAPPTSRTTEVAAGFAVHGTLATREFHHEGCSRLRGIGPRERTLFTGQYDALDSGYHPCPTCKRSR